MTQDSAPDCSHHSKEVAGISDMKVLAEMIGDLHYESLAEFLAQLSNKLRLDALRDRVGGRVELSTQLRYASGDIYNSSQCINEAWQICKPFMEQNKTDQP